MATRNVSKQASALAKARDRRRALDNARDEQDRRIEEATASVLVALEIRADAERALESATSRAGEALRALLAEDVTIDKAAALAELDVTEVRRLIRAAPVADSRSDARPERAAKASLTVLRDASESDGAARRVG